MHIVIIGAGLAGIAAAYKVLEDEHAGHTVTLLEASARYGGRALSDTGSIPGFVLEKGATQIQDPAINPLVGVARELGFATSEEPFQKGLLRVREDGNWADKPVDYPPVAAIVAEIADSYAITQHEPNATVIPPFADLGQLQLLALMNTTLGPITASADPWRYLAADTARESDTDFGPNLFVDQGIGTLVEAYGRQLAKFGKRCTVIFAKPARRIEWGTGGVRVIADGLDIAAAGCIVTVPVSLLAADDAIAFHPPLPGPQQSALRALKLGSYKKLAVTLAQVPAAIEVGTTYCIADTTNRGAWEYCRRASSPGVLFAQTAGSYAALLDGLPDIVVFENFRALLQSTYPAPLEFGDQRAMTNWTNAPFARGAYSYTAPLGSDPDDPAALGARTALAAPLGRLRIAGEATDLKFFGTLQAAFFEGQRAAGELLALG